MTGVWVLMAILGVAGNPFGVSDFGIPALVFDTRGDCERAILKARRPHSPMRCVFVERGDSR